MQTSLRNAHLAAGGLVVAFAAFVGITVNSAQPPLYTSDNPPPASVSTSTPAVNAEVEAMKQCAHDLKVERQRWFFDETGLTTTIDSGAAQAYADQLAAAGLEPKRPLPFHLCG